MALIAIALAGLFFNSRRGVILRAVSDDQPASWAVGIRVEARHRPVLGARGHDRALLAGVLWGSVQGVDWTLSLLLIKALAVAILGGLDSILGVLVAGVALGPRRKRDTGLSRPASGRRHARRRRIAHHPLHHHGAPLRPVRTRADREDLTHVLPARRRLSHELRRQTAPSSDPCRPLAGAGPVPGSRWPRRSIVSNLYLSGYLLPWLIWSMAALSLNLLVGWAGQIHLGYAAVMAIGAYGTTHLVRAGVPFEAAIARRAASCRRASASSSASHRSGEGPLSRRQHACHAISGRLGHQAMSRRSQAAAKRTLQVPSFRFLWRPDR